MRQRGDELIAETGRFNSPWSLEVFLDGPSPRHYGIGTCKREGQAATVHLDVVFEAVVSFARLVY